MWHATNFQLEASCLAHLGHKQQRNGWQTGLPQITMIDFLSLWNPQTVNKLVPFLWNQPSRITRRNESVSAVQLVCMGMGVPMAVMGVPMAIMVMVMCKTIALLCMAMAITRLNVLLSRRGALAASSWMQGCCLTVELERLLSCC